MKKQDIINFFDRMAVSWDMHNIHDDVKINAILDYAEITKGVSVLDVACGTGVLIPDYLARDVKKVVAVDISPAMINIANAKFSEPRVNFINADIEEANITEIFDRCVVYNAFPHFLNPPNLIRTLADRLKPGGNLTIAHSMSREKINELHSGEACKVSVELMSESNLAMLFKDYFNVNVCLSNEAMYVVSGVKK